MKSANDIKSLIMDIAEAGQKQATSLKENLKLLRVLISADEAVLELWKKKTELYEVGVQNAEAALRAVQKDGIAYTIIMGSVKLAESSRDEGKRQYILREDIAQTVVTIMIAAVKLAVFNTLTAVSSDNAQYVSQKGKAILEFAKNAVSFVPVVGTLLGVIELLKSLIGVAELNMKQNRDLIAMDESLANYCKQYSEQFKLLKTSGQNHKSLKKAIESLIIEAKREQSEVKKCIAETEAVLRPGTAI